MVSSQALLWVPYFIAVIMLESCSYVVRAQQSEYLLVPILMGCLAAIMSMYLLREDCTSPGGYAASISRVSGSIFFEGYVFMFVSLVTVAVYILGRINFIQDHKIQQLADKRPRRAGRLLKSGSWRCDVTERCCVSDDVARKRCDTVLRYAIILVCITAVVPDRADNCDLDESAGSCNNRNMRTMHFVGIGGGVSITLFAGLARAVLTTMELNADGSCSLTMKELYTTDKGKWRARYALGMALLSALVALGFLVAFMIVLADPEEAADMHLCILYNSRAACLGEHVPERWYNLTVAELGAWPCEWDDAALVTESPCTNPKCEDGDVLHDNQLRIVCEFHLLLYWIVTLLCTVMLMEDAEVWTPIAQKAENWGLKDSPGRPGDGAGRGPLQKSRGDGDGAGRGPLRENSGKVAPGNPHPGDPS